MLPINVGILCSYAAARHLHNQGWNSDCGIQVDNDEVEQWSAKHVGCCLLTFRYEIYEHILEPLPEGSRNVLFLWGWVPIKYAK